ncbi:MAG: transcriptional regulator, AbrB family [Lachnospiraceae bacterium]|jgi:bifunctional DNA-binding transcriptional regulator/antitoxin component of YhaV-PrlF toxin-antitoxin module|nr:transcriptional regulator, AbrB family [Lachnospiraceae bacterium]
MAKGIVRKIDELGRIVIPIEIRRSFEVMNREALTMSFVGGVMHLVKANGEVSYSKGLDELGRYTIPIEVRRSHNWEIGQAMDIYVDGGEICIRKDGEFCVICECTNDLHPVPKKEAMVCEQCAIAVADMVFTKDL